MQMNNTFLQVLHISVVSSLLILAMFFVNKLATRRYSLRWIQFLWILVAVRLFLPVHMVQIVVPEHAKTLNDIVRNVEKKTDIKAITSSSDKTGQLDNSGQGASVSKERSKEVITPSNNQISVAVTVVQYTISFITTIWILGVVWQLAKYLLSYWIFTRRLKKTNMQIEDEDTYQQLLNRINPKKNNIKLYRNPAVQSPFSYGLLHKSIILPDKQYNETELEAIMCHEVTHIQNHDIWVKAVLCIGKSLHWFNPFVYLMERTVNQNMEMLCDEEVVRDRKLEYRKMYSMTILNTIQDMNGKAPVAFASHFEGEGKQLKERFQNIIKPVKRRKAPLLIACLCVLCIAGSLITCNAVSDKNSEKESVAAAVSLPGPVEKEKEEPVTILVMGKEAIDEQDIGRTDSIVLVTWDPVSREVCVKSLLRDMYVQIPGYEDNKLNAAYHIGGTKLMKETVEQNFGVSIDYSIVVDFEGFQKAVDIMGGIIVDLTEEEAEYLNTTNYISKKEYRTLTAGENFLNGNQALGYARVRYVTAADGTVNDFGRVKRLQDMLRAMLDKLDTLSITEYTSLIKEAFSSVEFDMPLSQCLDLIGSLQKDAYSFSCITIPLENSYSCTQKNGKAVLIWDKEINCQALQ